MSNFRQNSHWRLKLRSNFTITLQDHLEHRDPHLEFRHHHHDPVAFNTVVAEIERHRQDKEWARMCFEEHHQDMAGIVRHAEEYRKRENITTTLRAMSSSLSGRISWNDEERVDVTNRLSELFLKLDVNPTDRYVYEKELTDWNVKQAEIEVLHRMQKEMELHDKNIKNRDEFVSFSEYEPPS